MPKTQKPMQLAKNGKSKGVRAKLGLVREQNAALEELVRGKSVPETAKAAGVNKTTVYRWIKNNPKFLAEYNIWHEEMEQKTRSRMLGMLCKAADAVEVALEEGDAKLGMRLMEKMGVIHVAAARLTDPEELRMQKELEEKRRRVERECENVKLDTQRILADVHLQDCVGELKGEGGGEE